MQTVCQSGFELHNPPRRVTCAVGDGVASLRNRPLGTATGSAGGRCVVDGSTPSPRGTRTAGLGTTWAGWSPFLLQRSGTESEPSLGPAALRSCRYSQPRHHGGGCLPRSMCPVGHLCQRCGYIHFAGDPKCPDKRGNARRAAKPQRKVWHSARWKRVRRYIAMRSGQTCELCDTPTPLADGIADHKDGFRDEHDPRAWDTERMQWICRVCSGRKDGAARYN
jgi:hypothetical protein